MTDTEGMAHPLFEKSAQHYPLDLAEASELFQRLSTSVRVPEKIDSLYRSSGPDLPPLFLYVDSTVIWRFALDTLVSRHRMRQFCEVLLRDVSLAPTHPLIERLLADQPSHDSRHEHTDAAGVEVCEERVQSPANDRYAELVNKKHTSGLSAEESLELDGAFAQLSKEDDAIYGPVIEKLLRESGLRQR